ncbi:MAG TPA: YbjN domain-containing protein [Jatrophihabitantaceae bacterium]|nr:YbjN domain-containing protein [Jatrophihabitantaceae bacterium]
MSHADDLDRILRDQGMDYEHPTADAFVVALPGEKRLKTACWLTVGVHALEIEAFVLRHPEENQEKLYAFLLQHNARMYAVSWAMDSMGDIYLRGRLPLSAITPDEIDRVLGSVLEYSDGTFNTLLELGFASSIRREWDWRVKRGESLANLQAFAHLAERPAD